MFDRFVKVPINYLKNILLVLLLLRGSAAYKTSGQEKILKIFKSTGFYSDLKTIFDRKNKKIHIIELPTFNTVILKIDHLPYLDEVQVDFKHYFNAVQPQNINGRITVDYSYPHEHKVKGFDKFPILFPSLAEPIDTTKHYTDFAKLDHGSVIFDLGAYSGLTSIIFKEIVGKTGKVVAVEPDKNNLSAVKENFKKYQEYSGLEIDLVEAAVWRNNEGVSFYHEGNMGSTAIELLTKKRKAKVVLTPTVTLSKLAEISKVSKVDFIKVDIEGGESAIFDDAEFFKKYRPKMIVEAHKINEVLTTEYVTKHLESYNYQIKVVVQTGAEYPLLECTPKELC